MIGRPGGCMARYDSPGGSVGVCLDHSPCNVFVLLYRSMRVIAVFPYVSHTYIDLSFHLMYISDVC